MGLDHLWAGWRRAYIEAITDAPPAPTGARPEPGSAELAGAAPAVAPPAPPAGSLFEGILRLPDDEGLVVHRGSRCSVVLNAYPYTNGHVLVLPNRAVPRLDELTVEEHGELWTLVREAVAAIETAYRCDGVNVGMNLGKAAGAGVPDHLHAHVLPRWDGDTNFMTVVAETRVLPETLSATWLKLRGAWPT
jgi:diadenosine tetraphosphate (Ap4A) HIT family hydrolase